MHESALHLAAGLGHLEIVKLLVPFIGLDFATIYHRVPLEYAIHYNQLEIAKYLLAVMPLSSYAAYPTVRKPLVSL